MGMPVTLKDIHDKLQGIEDAVVHGVDHYVKLPTWIKIFAGIVLVLVIALFITVFKKHDAPSGEYLQKISQLDSTIKYKQKTIDALQAGQAMRDSVIIDQLSRIGTNKATQTKIIHQYEQIPNHVNSLDKSGLRSEITNY
jgi:hypothetical protein